MSERKDPIHIWTNPLHDSIDGMTPRQQAALSKAVEVEIHFDEAYELALLEANIPIRYVSAALRAIAPVRENEKREHAAVAVGEVLWALDGAEGVAKRRALLGDGGESLREAAKMDGVSKSSLHRKELEYRVGTATTRKVE